MIERLNVNQETKDYIYSSRTIVKDQVATFERAGIPVEKLTVNFMEDEKVSGLIMNRHGKSFVSILPLILFPGGMKNIEVTKKACPRKLVLPGSESS